jgi:hypothetical protein
LYGYRYFKHELLEKKAIAKTELPVFFESWMDPSSEYCMFSPQQLKTWTNTHLKGVGWYLDCGLGYVHAEEKDLKSSAETADTPALLVGELEKLDEEARRKLIAKVEAEDKKKALKITQHEEKVAAREQAKIEKQAEKIAKKEEKKKNPKVQEVPKPSSSSIVDAESQHQSQEQRGTKRDSEYLELSQDKAFCGQIRDVVDLGEDQDIDELVLNTSLAAALPQDEDDPVPKMFEEIQRFLDEVCGLTYFLDSLYFNLFC